jgi:CRP/FNR family transcriptional regulator
MGKNGPSPRSLEIIQRCLTCPVRDEALFCQLSEPALEELDAIRQTIVWPEKSLLFTEGQKPHGLFVLCSGKARLTATFPGGRLLILRLAKPGEVLGLGAVISNAPYEMSAETLELSQTNLIPRDSFLRFMQNHGEVSLRVAQHLSMELRRTIQQVARIALAPTARSKLASLLLDWAGRDGQPTAEGVRFELSLNHEEIGELIGSSRETVARLLIDFRRKGLTQTNGKYVTIPDPHELQELLS